MLVSKRMTEKPVTIGPDDTLGTARKVMLDGKFGRLPVVQGDKLVGIVTDRDTREHSGHLDHTKVNVAMTENPLTVAPDVTVESAAALMLRHKIGGLPVVDHGAVVGIITTSDVLQAFMDVTGASEGDTVRIDLVFEGAHHDVAGAFRTIEGAGGTVLGLGTYTEKWDKSRVFYIRVRVSDPTPVADALMEAGYKVIGIHEQPEQAK